MSEGMESFFILALAIIALTLLAFLGHTENQISVIETKHLISPEMIIHSKNGKLDTTYIYRQPNEK